MDKPPLGIVPRRLTDEARLSTIHQGIMRYIQASQPVPDEWLEEYSDIVQRWSFEDGRKADDIPVNTEMPLLDKVINPKSHRRSGDRTMSDTINDTYERRLHTLLEGGIINEAQHEMVLKNLSPDNKSWINRKWEKGFGYYPSDSLPGS